MKEISKKMNFEDLQKLIRNPEDEHIEFKEAKTQFSTMGNPMSRNSILGYAVAIGNESGGTLVLGVSNNGEIVGTGTEIGGDTKKKIYDACGLRIGIDEVLDSDRRVIVISIPPRPHGHILKFYGVPLMRVGDSLEEMPDDQQRKILLELDDDFSASIHPDARMEHLDSEAINALRKFYGRKNPENTSVRTISDERLLSDLGLIVGGKITHAAVILLAKKDFLNQSFSQAEICFEYRNDDSTIEANERIDYREPFLLSLDKVWERIALRNQIYQIQEGLFRRDIKAFNEEVIREALLNAVCHRDYAMQGSVYIKQSPRQIQINNPGGFPRGVTVENIVTVPSTPRNRRLAELFQKLGFVERSGQGADKIFRFTIEEGKGRPDFSHTTSSHVVLLISAVVYDIEFVKFLEKIIAEKQTTFSTEDLILLEKIRTQEDQGVTQKMVKRLLDLGVVEMHGRTSGSRFFLSHSYYQFSKESGKYTRIVGVSRDKRKELILNHIRKSGRGKMEEFAQIFPELKRTDIGNLLAELKRQGLITVIKKGPNTYWVCQEMP